MTGDRKKFNRAISKWNDLKKEGLSSLPRDESMAAVISTHYPWNELKGSGIRLRNRALDLEEWEQFDEEAGDLAGALDSAGIEVELRINATPADLDDIIGDERVSDIFVIGNGNLCGVFLQGCIGNTYDWYQASQVSSHLKTGNFVQRHCGNKDRNLNVPFGMFVVAEFEQVIAPVGNYFHPHSYLDSSGLRQVTKFGPVASYEDIKNTFAYEAST